MAKLTYLDLSGNHIEEIIFNNQDKIESWYQLRSLNLADNKLSELPVELAELDDLMQLNISRNESLQSIPNEIGLLKNIFSFKVEGLEKLQIPKDLRPVNGKNPRPLLDFLSQRLVKQVPHSFMKVFIVGAQKSGKSVLARGLDADPQKEPESMGTGLEVRTTKLQNINISLWEFDGYDDHYSSQPCFISERAIYVVVYNTNESEGLA